jgi:elongation factor P
MLSYNELKPGKVIVWKDEPWLVLDYQFLRMQQRKPVARTKIKSLKSGKVLEQTFHYGDTFDEADVNKKSVKFLYESKGEYWFSDIKDPSKRFSIDEGVVGTTGKYIKQNSEVTALLFEDEPIGIEPAIKVELEVTETPPGIKGATASGGNKPATLETGAVVNVPMFINAGDVVRINTQTGEYTERIEKASGI